MNLINKRIIIHLYKRIKNKIVLILNYCILFKNIYLIFINELFKKLGIFYYNKNYIIKLWNGLKFEIRPNTWDIKILYEIFYKKIYTPIYIKIPENAIVIDIGAYIGDFSIYIAKNYKQSKIYSYEPSPNNFHLLKNNICFNLTFSSYFL